MALWMLFLVLHLSCYIAKGVSTKEAPTKGSLSNGTLIQGAPANETPGEEAPAKGVPPVKEPPSKGSLVYTSAEAKEETAKETGTNLFPQKKKFIKDRLKELKNLSPNRTRDWFASKVKKVEASGNKTNGSSN